MHEDLFLQVLPGRSHPHTSMSSSSGFLLVGTRLGNCTKPASSATAGTAVGEKHKLEDVNEDDPAKRTKLE